MALSELRFCPKCAGTLEWRAVQHSDVPHPVCTKFGFVLWQNPKPSIEALITRGEGMQVEVLLGRRAAEPSRGLWDIPGGFLNVGDHLEVALIRECRREMGVEVRVCGILDAFEDEFLGTQIITLVYLCEIATGEPRPADIIDEVRWFRLAEPPPLAFPAVAKALAALQRRLAP